MSYLLTLHCGCEVYVSCHPKTRVAHTRLVQKRGPQCLSRKHEIGAHLYLWEILPDARNTAEPQWIGEDEPVRDRRPQSAAPGVRPGARQ